MTVKTPLLSGNKNWPQKELEPYQKILPPVFFNMIQCVGDHPMLRSQDKVLFGLSHGLALANRTTGEYSYLDTKVFKSIVGCGCYFKNMLQVVTFFEDGDVWLWRLNPKTWTLKHVKKLGSNLPLVAPVDLKKKDCFLTAYNPQNKSLYRVTSQKVELVGEGDLDTLYKARQVSEKDAGDWIQT